MCVLCLLPCIQLLSFAYDDSVCMFSHISDEIRQDVEDAVYRMKPWRSETDATLFNGWARMAQPIEGFNVVEV